MRRWRSSRGWPRSAQGDFVFPGGKADRPLSNMAMLMLLRRMGRGDLTAHGFRSTFRDWAAERTNFPAEVAEMALAHTVSDKVEAAYRRGDLFQKRRQLAEAWATFCAAPPAKGRANSQALAPEYLVPRSPPIPARLPQFELLTVSWVT